MLNEKAYEWTEWERRDFQEELIRNAEGILTDECNSFKQNTLFREWSSHETGENRIGGVRDISEVQSIRGAQRVFQEKVSSNTHTHTLSLSLSLSLSLCSR
jgi:hypothetical protein